MGRGDLVGWCEGASARVTRANRWGDGVMAANAGGLDLQRAGGAAQASLRCPSGCQRVARKHDPGATRGGVRGANLEANVTCEGAVVH